MSMTHYNPENPLVVQGDHTILVEVDSPLYGAARDQLVRFAELIKAPEHIHTYRVTPLSIWNACAAGTSVEEISEALRGFSKYPVPANVETEIRDWAHRYGRLRLSRNGEDLVLEADDAVLAEQVSRHKAVAPLLVERISSQAFRIRAHSRGEIKQALIKVGFPVEDLAGYVDGERLAFELRASLADGRPFELRHYQVQAADAFSCGRGEQRRVRRHHASLRRRQDDRRHGLHGEAANVHADLDHQRDRQPPVDPGAAGEDHAGGRPDRGVQRFAETDPAGHSRQLPDHDLARGPPG